MNSKEISNPEKIGPGFWVYGHKKARSIKNESDKIDFRNFIYWIRDNFPCLECRGHFRDMLIQYPLEKSWTVIDKNGNDTGLCDWFCDRHNQVNIRLGKPTISRLDVWNMYSDENYLCSKHCDEGSPKLAVTNQIRTSPSKINLFRGNRNANLFKILGLSS